MRRVLLIGSGGAGKSTLARHLAARTGLPLVHLDALYWRPGWNATPPDEWARVVGELVARDTWLMDGNYGGTLDLRFAACDTVIFLDLPRALCLWRILRRWLALRGRTREDIGPGCPERMTWEFVKWVWTYPARRREGILRRLAALDGGRRAIVLRSPAEVDRFLSRFP